MRTTKRFTPAVLDRFQAEGRGQGTFDDYAPWHRVSRGDPASHGRSHLVKWKGRQLHFLSDDEWVAGLFATLCPDLVDLREQFPLALHSDAHELGAYDVRLGASRHSGTTEIAQQLGYRHPRVNGGGRSAPWTMSTDLLLTFLGRSGTHELLAVSCKPKKPDDQPRSLELLQIERAYWQERRVDWILITPDLYEKSVELTLRGASWALSAATEPWEQEIAESIAERLVGAPLTAVLYAIAESLRRDLSDASRAFWQSVWNGRLRLDLRRGWRPHLPVHLLPDDKFIGLNPIACRRSSWI